MNIHAPLDHLEEGRRDMDVPVGVLATAFEEEDLVIGILREPGGPGYFYPVTLVADVDHGCKLVDNEQFGPALPIIRYLTLVEAIAKANDSAMGLGGSVWGTNVEEAREVAGKLECGSVWINRHGTIQPNAPFGGVKQSGFGWSSAPKA